MACRAWRAVISLCLFSSIVFGKPVEEHESLEIGLHMPHVKPQVADTYLCFPVRMSEAPVYITAFQPEADMNVAHHMLLYGCEEPGEMNKAWNCGEMNAKVPDYPKGSVCAKEPKIIYAWAMDAPALKMPDDVAFKVGGDTDIKWLVLQVHYKDVTAFLPPKNTTDTSGITLRTTTIPQPKQAGVYLLASGGEILPHSTTYMETACSVNEPLQMHPFAYRVHAHSHGVVVAGYRVREGQWAEIGRESPKKPQMFYPVTDPRMVVHEADILAARCTMVNNENRTVFVGPTQNDEMCNFYIMYWVKGDDVLKDSYCVSQGPPFWSWRSREDLSNTYIPTNASIEPGTDKLWKATENFIEQMDEAMEVEKEGLEDEFEQIFRELGAREEGPSSEDYSNYINPYHPEEISQEGEMRERMDPRVWEEEQEDQWRF